MTISGARSARIRTKRPTTRRSTAAELAALAEHPRVIGIGETGLDFHYDHSPREVQERVFRAHIAASRGQRPAADHPCPRGRRRDRAHPARGAPAGGGAALLQQRPGAGRSGARARLLHLDLRHRDVPQRRGTARHRPRPAARSAAGRDRRALSRAGAVSRQAQRAGLCRRDGRRRRGAERHRARANSPRSTTDNFFRLFHKGEPPAGSSPPAA